MLDVALIVCAVVAALAGLYGLYFVVVAFPFTGLRKPDVAPDKVHRFAVVVFAHNEAPVIGQLLESLRALRYPNNAYDVFVVADNCADETAAIALSGDAIVWERFDPDHSGKGCVMAWFFDRFAVECAHKYDACAIFDADNLVDPGFLEAMNDQLCLGYQVSIGLRLSKNPSSTPVAGASALFWLLQARFFHAPRVRRGLPCLTVGGTGFVFDLEVLPDGFWSTESVCEDIEFTLRAIADGHAVSFTNDAIFYDEQPRTWWQSFVQRYRWSLGALQMLRYGTPALLRTFRQRWRTSFDALIYSFGGLLPGVSALASIAMTLLLGAKTGQWAALGLGTVVGAIVGYVAIAAVGRLLLALHGQWWDGAWKAVAVFPIYLVTWSVIGVVVLFYRNRRWVSIPHTDGLRLDDVRAAAGSGTAKEPWAFPGRRDADPRSGSKGPWAATWVADEDPDQQPGTAN